MLKTLTTIVSSKDGYPFDIKNHHLSSFNYEVKVRFPLQEGSSHLYFKKIEKISELELSCRSLIKLTGIVSDRVLDDFLLVYEYVPYGLEEFSTLKIQLSKIELDLNHLCESLLQKKILPNYSLKNFGFDENKELKYFILPDFTEISDNSELKKQIENMDTKIKELLKPLKFKYPFSLRETIEEDRTSQRRSERNLSAYNKKFEEKISQIEYKLLLNKKAFPEKLGSNQRIKRRKKLSNKFTDESISVSSQSQSSLRLADSYRIQQKEPKSRTQNEYDHIVSRANDQQFYQRSYDDKKKENSLQVDQYGPQRPKGYKGSKLSNSLIIKQNSQEMKNLKNHKSSFGDYSNSGNDSQKQLRLKRRISFALEKSQRALKIYEKYQSRRSGKASSSQRQ